MKLGWFVWISLIWTYLRIQLFFIFSLYWNLKIFSCVILWLVSIFSLKTFVWKLLLKKKSHFSCSPYSFSPFHIYSFIVRFTLLFIIIIKLYACIHFPFIISFTFVIIIHIHTQRNETCRSKYLFYKIFTFYKSKTTTIYARYNILFQH